MIIKILVENTSLFPMYKKKNGLCLYIETQKHKILFDLGKNGLFFENAKKMGVDISEIDTVIISHGHMDHGGALRLFLEHNQIAKIYVRENAFDKHYTRALGLYIDVGIDSSLKSHKQIVMTKEQTFIEEELLLFSGVKNKELFSESNYSLYADIEGVKVFDNFSHEQYLIISDGKNKILVSGCSHMGIINIKKDAEYIIKERLTHIMGGFHLYNPISRRNEKKQFVQGIAKQLDNGSTHYYTYHCTGKQGFSVLRQVLSDKVTYLSAGTMIEI